jgi:hypothetical protein
MRNTARERRFGQERKKLVSRLLVVSPFLSKRQLASEQLDDRKPSGKLKCQTDVPRHEIDVSKERVADLVPFEKNGKKNAVVVRRWRGHFLTTPRAATSSCSASGESPCQTKPSPLLPQRKAKSQQHKKRALLRGATEQNLPSRPRHRNATGNKARERFLAKSKKNWPRVLDRLHVLSRACLSEQADIMSSRCLLEQRDPQRKERRVFFGKSRSGWVL